MTRPPAHPFAPCPQQFNLARHVLAAAEVTPDKAALRILGPEGHDDWTYRRLAETVAGLATELAEQAPAGACVMLRLGNGAGFPVAFLAAIRAGLVPVVTSADLTAPEITAIADALRPALVIAGSGIARPAGPWPVLALDAIDADTRGGAPTPAADTRAGDAAYVLYTSGTSGRPRGVVHAHRAVWARGMMHRDWQGLGAGDRLLHTGALNWSYTLGVGLLDVWAAGATALCLRSGTGAADLPDLIRAEGVTILASVPGIYRRLVRQGDLGFPALRHGLSAGEALPAALRQAWRAATGTDLHEALGMTECSTFISGSPARPAPEGSCGFVQPGRQVGILDELGRPVPPGTAGILAIHETEMGRFLRYADEDSGPQGWFITGDVVVQDATGAIRHLGRADDMMNAGGYRVSPLEVEEALNGLPGVIESAAVELPVRADVRVIAAAYVGPADPADFDRYLAERLAPYKRPRLYRRVDALPRSANGKINRRALREEWTRNP